MNNLTEYADDVFHCDECGHQHAGRRWAYICVGCHCPVRKQSIAPIDEPVVEIGQGAAAAIAKYDTLAKIVSQIEWCNYEAIGGPLVNNIAFIALKRMAEQEREVKAKILRRLEEIDKTRFRGHFIAGVHILMEEIEQEVKAE